MNTQAIPATQTGQIMNMSLASLPQDRDLSHIPMNLSQFQLSSPSFQTEQSTDDKESLKFFKLIPCRFRKAGKVCCGDARETREPHVIIGRIVRKSETTKDLPAFQDLDGTNFR